MQSCYVVDQSTQKFINNLTKKSKFKKVQIKTKKLSYMISTKGCSGTTGFSNQSSRRHKIKTERKNQVRNRKMQKNEVKIKGVKVRGYDFRGQKFLKIFSTWL